MADELNTPNDTPASDAPVGGDTLHDDISRAFEEVETRDAPPAPGATPAPPSTVVGQPPDPGDALAGQRRDPATGKFISAPAAPPAAAERPAAAPPKPGPTNGAKPPAAAAARPAEPPKPPDPATPPPPQVRAPASWKPGAREHWAKLPAEVQQEVVRRETEVARTMSESARARDALAHVQGVLAPFAANIHASGQDALAAIDNFFRADNTLRHGSISEKATLVADIIKSYGVDITALDGVLAGQPAQSDPNAMLADKMRREMQAQLQPVLGFVNQMQGQRRTAVAQINTEAAGEVDTFSQDGAHEFFDDVRADMADIIDLFTGRGQTITLQDAYDRAIKLNPQVSEIISRRAETERANAAAAAAQRARRTAASIGGSAAPAGAAPGPAGDNRRAEIEAAWDQSSGG